MRENIRELDNKVELQKQQLDKYTTEIQQYTHEAQSQLQKEVTEKQRSLNERIDDLSLAIRHSNLPPVQ